MSGALVGSDLEGGAVVLGVAAKWDDSAQFFQPRIPNAEEGK